MAENHIIMEEKNLTGDGIIAIPESRYHKGLTLLYQTKEVDAVYERVGLISGLTIEDFLEEPYYGPNPEYMPPKYIPIQLGDHLKEPTKKANDAVRKCLEAVCKTKDLEFDKAKLLDNPYIVSQIIEYEVIKCNIYIVRFSGKKVKHGNDNINLSIAYFLAPQDGEIFLEGNQLFVGGKLTELPNGTSLRNAVEFDTYEGTLTAFKGGSASFHRKNLKPYRAKGRNMESQLFGPRIVLGR